MFVYQCENTLTTWRAEPHTLPDWSAGALGGGGGVLELKGMLKAVRSFSSRKMKTATLKASFSGILEFFWLINPKEVKSCLTVIFKGKASC